MPEIDLRAIDDTIILHIRKEQGAINAYTLATTLIALADAAKNANSQINPGYEIEVVVETLADGSFKAKLRAVYKVTRSIFSSQALQTVVLAVMANFFYEKTLAPDQTVRVTVNTEEVIITQEDTRIVVPRSVYDAEQQVQGSSRFREKIGEAFHAILSDPEVESISIDPGQPGADELPPVSRERLEPISLPPEENVDQQIVEEIADLHIIRAILEHSKRRWEFSWRGFRIAAPILHDGFYSDFTSHRITIAPGDMLRARLRIYQRRDLAAGVLVNERFEVLEVLEHRPAQRYVQGEI